MADSFGKKEREKKRQKRKKDKAERKLQPKEGKSTDEFMYVDAMGNLTSVKPDPAEKVEVNLEDISISVSRRIDEEEDPIKKGQVNFFNSDKGYGFIVEAETRESLFVHINDVDGIITERDKVVFEVGSGPKGPVAIKVRLMTKEDEAPKPPKVVEPKEGEAPKEGEVAKDGETPKSEVKEEVKEEAKESPAEEKATKTEEKKGE